MSLIGTTTRTALKVARLPADVALGVIGRRSGPGKVAQTAVDRVDAAARETVGRATGDRRLQAEAKLGNAAADERVRGAELEEQATKKKAAAAKRRKRAQATAQTQRSEAAQREKERKRSVEQEAAAERKQQQDRADRGKLEQLDTKKKALKEREDALQAKDEAQRLEAAAAATKQARKNGA